MKRKVALVTGATGFVGSHLCARLRNEGWKVYALVRKGSRKPGLAHDGTTAGMIRIMKKVQPTVVFHLASLFISEHKSEDVEALCRSNVLFGMQLLEAMAATGTKLLVNTGTSWQHFEGRPYSAVNLYAATKQAFEDILAFYCETGAVRAVTLKLFDAYGPGDDRPKLWSILRKANGNVLKMSPGRQKMDLVYIDDAVEAYLVAASRLHSNRGGANESYAVSSERTMSLKEVVSLYSKTSGSKLRIKWGGRPYRAREVMVPWSTGKRLPGWRPRTPLKDGLKRMVE